MNTGIVVSTQRRLLAIVIAATLALTAVFGPMVLDQLTGSQTSPTAAACLGSSGGC